MSDGISIEWPQKDVDALYRQIDQAMTYLHYDYWRALGAAGRALLASLNASTRMAPKVRKITERTDMASGRRDLKVFQVEGWFGRPRRPATKIVRSKSISNVQRKYGKIRFSGLARMTWRVATRKVWRPMMDAMGVATHEVANKAEGFVDVETKQAAAETYILIRNRLPYIEEALQGKARTVQTAMERAAAGMQHSIERQIVKRMGLGRLSR